MIVVVRWPQFGGPPRDAIRYDRSWLGIAVAVSKFARLGLDMINRASVAAAVEVSGEAAHAGRPTAEKLGRDLRGVTAAECLCFLCHAFKIMAVEPCVNERLRISGMR